MVMNYKIQMSKKYNEKLRVFKNQIKVKIVNRGF